MSGFDGWLQMAQITLNSGRTSAFKIECDEITDSEIGAAACLFARILPPFSGIEGVPRGGIRLARALERAVCDEGPLLIVDDVLTTGGSIERHRAGRDAIGAVLFSRGPCPEWITPLFTLHRGLWSA